METDRLLRGLDAQQRAAVMSDASPLAIIAAAGSGKTTVLTRRIARRIEDGSADAGHVLALTFTREAAGELRRRLRRLDVVTPIETGTFHAIALRLLSDRALAAGRAAPVIAPDRLRIMREVITETRRRIEPSAALADIDWARARMIDPARFAESSRQLRRRVTLDGAGYADVLQRFQQLKRRRGVVDFDDLLYEVLDAMRRDPVFTEIVRWRFRHLFVDESQDLNPLQFAVLQQIRGDRRDICLVGDPRQAIYGWNGADPTLLANVELHLPGITVLNLIGNHRCSPQIVRAGAAALQGANVIDDTESRREDGADITVLTCGDEHDEAATVARRVRVLHSRFGGHQVAVLARTNDQLIGIDRALRDVGIPTELAGGRGGSRSPLERLIDEVARISSREQLAEWAERIWVDGTEDALRRRMAEEVDRFLSSGVAGGLRGWIDARHPFDDLADDETGDAAADGTQQGAVERGAVTLATFHAAKGREWSAVVVTGVEVGYVPHGSAGTPAQLAEEARLLYVALTRAADDLTITAATSRKGAAVAESPWLAAVRSTVSATERLAVPPPDVRRPRAAPDPLAELRAWRAGVARAAGVAEKAVCSDQTLRSLLASPPADVAALAARLGVGSAAAERLAPRLLGLLAVQPSA